MLIISTKPVAIIIQAVSAALMFDSCDCANAGVVHSATVAIVVHAVLRGKKDLSLTAQPRV
jgi:hypothetical protein